jgi:hypothetical protein
LENLTEKTTENMEKQRPLIQWCVTNGEKLHILCEESKDSQSRNLLEIEEKIINRFRELTEKRDEFENLKTNY